jgi:thiamine monophosphate kinase
MEKAKKHLLCPMTIIGEVTAGEPYTVTLVDREGEAIPWKQKGWDHFQANSKS